MSSIPPHSRQACSALLKSAPLSRGDDCHHDCDHAAEVEEHVLGIVHPLQCDHARTEADERTDEDGLCLRVVVGGDG